MTKTEAIDKVRKLLALANSANENEAAAAAGRAADIMERHRLDAAMVAEAEQRDVEREDREPFDLNDEQRAERAHARIPTWYWALAWGCAVGNRCKPHAVYAGDGRWAMTFIGRPSDAAAARYMVDALANDVDRLAVAFVASVRGRASRSAGKSFRLGAASKIAKRLEDQIREVPDRIRGELRAAGDASAVARLDNALAVRKSDGERLDAFVAGHGIKYGSARALSVSNADAFRAGSRAGDGVSLGGGHALGAGARALKAGAA